ncbi:FAD-binding domain [Bradyrhizobium jicamae]|uniref:FAD-binding domain n=1 Tax=Bradyrhizobium jicamae TaxID=280332 RepID=UPI001BAB63FD|nr:FAD-binding domain [Bradyrhizobium jicamae]MBR0754296.1 FAD-binding domain [Bradyrhizobium jicamae]
MKSILISGVGVAGPTIAFWLKQAGFEPTLVERTACLRIGGYVIDFWGLGYDIAERMGLIEEINRIGYHVKEMQVVDGVGRRRVGFGTNVFAELTGGRYVTLPRSELSRLLFEKSKACAEWIFDDEIIGLREDADGVLVRLKHAGERRFDLVIGADGLHSSVRQLAFGPSAQFEKHLGYMVAAFEVSGYRPREEDVYLMFGQPGRMVGRFTLHDDRTLFLFVFVAPDAGMPATLAQQKALLQKVYGHDGWECPKILAELARADTIYLDSVSQIRMQNWTQGRVALIGDAAFCVSLLAGQGSALAMISAYVMAGELALASGRYQEAFARYETLLRDYIGTKQVAAERFAGAFAPKTRAGLFFRNQVIRAFAFPGLAKLFIGRDIADKVDLPNYSWSALR